MTVEQYEVGQLEFRPFKAVLRTRTNRFYNRVRWIMLVPVPIAGGAIGWVVAGPWLAVPLAAWPMWRAMQRWSLGERGVELAPTGLRQVEDGRGG